MHSSSAQDWFAAGERIRYDPKRVGRPFGLFKRMPGIRKLWSKGYNVTEAELRELHSALDRHDGLFYLAAAAGFAADHEARQVDLAQERLSALGLQIERLPGGHLTTTEQAGALAVLTARFEQRVSAAPFMTDLPAKTG